LRNQTALGLVDELEQTLSVNGGGRSERRLPPAVQRRDFLTPREKALINDIEWGVEGPFRGLLGKLPVQCPCPHALSPESAKLIMSKDSRRKYGRAWTILVQTIATHSARHRVGANFLVAPSHADGIAALPNSSESRSETT
jgi:hypothetical protein